MFPTVVGDVWPAHHLVLAFQGIFLVLADAPATPLATPLPEASGDTVPCQEEVPPGSMAGLRRR